MSHCTVRLLQVRSTGGIPPLSEGLQVSFWYKSLRYTFLEWFGAMNIEKVRLRLNMLLNPYAVLDTLALMLLSEWFV